MGDDTKACCFFCGIDAIKPWEDPEPLQTKTRTHILDLLLMEEILHQLIGSFSVFPLFTRFYTYQVVLRKNRFCLLTEVSNPPFIWGFSGHKIRNGWLNELMVFGIQSYQDGSMRTIQCLFNISNMDDLNLMVSINRYNIYIYIYHIQTYNPILVKQWCQFGGFGSVFLNHLHAHKERFCSQCADSGADHCHRDFDEVARYEATGTL